MSTEDPFIFRRDLQRQLKVCSETMRVWIRDKKLPPPDMSPTPKSVAWRVSTLRAAGFNVSPN